MFKVTKDSNTLIITFCSHFNCDLLQIFQPMRAQFCNLTADLSITNTVIKRLVDFHNFQQLIVQQEKSKWSVLQSSTD